MSSKDLFILILSISTLFIACDSSKENNETEEVLVEGTLDFANLQGESIRLEAPLRVEDSDRARISLTALWNEEIVTDVEWSSTDETVATVTPSEDGIANGVKPPPQHLETRSQRPI